MKAKFYLEIEQEINEIDGHLTTSENVEKHLNNLLFRVENKPKKECFNKNPSIIKSAQYEYTVKSEIFN
jgi:hypothetical protein